MKLPTHCLGLLHFTGFTVLLSISQGSSSSPGSQCNPLGTVLRQSSGLIQTPRYPDVYPGNHLCVWRLQPLRGRALYLTFRFFKLGWDRNSCRHDNLTITQVLADKQERRIFCGNGDDIMAQDPVYIPSSIVDITFKADNVFNGERGFELEFHAVSCYALSIPHGTQVRLDDNRVTIICPEGTRLLYQCINDEWYPPPPRNIPLCLVPSNRWPIIVICIVAGFALLFIIFVIVLAVCLTRRWREKAKKRKTYDRVALAEKANEPKRIKPYDAAEDEALRDIEFEDQQDGGPDKGVVICKCHESPYIVAIPPMKQPNKAKENDYVQTPALPPKRVTYADPLEVRKAPPRPIYDPRNPGCHYVAPSALKTRTLPSSTSCPQFQKSQTLPANTSSSKMQEHQHPEEKECTCNDDVVNTTNNQPNQNGQVKNSCNNSDHERAPNGTSAKPPPESSISQQKKNNQFYTQPLHRSCPDVCACIAK